MNFEDESTRIPEVPRRDRGGVFRSPPSEEKAELHTILSAKLVLGILVAVAGAIFLLDNLGVLRDDFFNSWWPVGVMALGLVQLCFGDSALPRALGLGVLLLGGLLLLGKLQPDLLNIDDLWKLWPLGLVILGGSLAYSALVPKPAGAGGRGDTTNIFAFWSGHVRRISSQSFKGGDLTAIMGGYELDFTEADIAEGEEAVLNTFSLMGGGEIRVPKTWEVSIEVTPIMGGVEAKTATPPSDAPRKVLHIRGFAMMGGIEVKN